MKAKIPLFSYCMERTFLFEPPENLIHLSFGNAMSGREEGHTIRHLFTFAAHLFVLLVQVDIFARSSLLKFRISNSVIANIFLSLQSQSFL